MQKPMVKVLLVVAGASSTNDNDNINFCNGDFFLHSLTKNWF